MKSIAFTEDWCFAEGGGCHRALLDRLWTVCPALAW